MKTSRLISCVLLSVAASASVSSVGQPMFPDRGFLYSEGDANGTVVSRSGVDRIASTTNLPSGWIDYGIGADRSFRSDSYDVSYGVVTNEWTNYDITTNHFQTVTVVTNEVQKSFTSNVVENIYYPKFLFRNDFLPGSYPTQISNLCYKITDYLALSWNYSYSDTDSKFLSMNPHLSERPSGYDEFVRSNTFYTYFFYNIVYEAWLVNMDPPKGGPSSIRYGTKCWYVGFGNNLNQGQGHLPEGTTTEWKGSTATVSDYGVMGTYLYFGGTNPSLEDASYRFNKSPDGTVIVLGDGSQTYPSDQSKYSTCTLKMIAGTEKSGKYWVRPTGEVITSNWVEKVIVATTNRWDEFITNRIWYTYTYTTNWSTNVVHVIDNLALESDYVPKTTRINGVPLTQDITIQGMTDNALVLTNSSIKTQSGGTVTPANLGAVANDSTYTTMAGKANNSVQNDSTYQTMAGKANSAVQPETLVQTVNAVKNLHWDPGLQVTWTNVVNNGHIYYVTVTNTNISTL